MLFAHQVCSFIQTMLGNSYMEFKKQILGWDGVNLTITTKLVFLKHLVNLDKLC